MKVIRKIKNKVIAFLADTLFEYGHLDMKVHKDKVIMIVEWWYNVDNPIPEPNTKFDMTKFNTEVLDNVEDEYDENIRHGYMTIAVPWSKIPYILKVAIVHWLYARKYGHYNFLEVV